MPTARPPLMLPPFLPQARRETRATELRARRREELSLEQQEWLEQREGELRDRAAAERSLSANQSNLPLESRIVSSEVRFTSERAELEAVDLTPVDRR